MSVDLAEKKQPLNSEDAANSFIVITGILSVLSYPIFYFIWDMEPIGVGKYIELLVIFILLFLLLMFAIQKMEIFRDSLALYINWVMPAFCIITSLAVAGVFSASRYAVILTTLHLAFLLAYFFERKYSLGIRSFSQVNRSVLYILPAGYGFIFWIWVCRTYDLLHPKLLSTWIRVPAIVLLVLGCLWGMELWQKRVYFKYNYVTYLLTSLLLIGLVYRPELFFDRWHYNYFLAPITDVDHGKMLFVNATSQYGVGIIYALALAFSALRFPIGYEGLSFIVVILAILQYLLLAFMLWKATEDLVAGIGGLLAMVYFNYLTVLWPSMLMIPAQGPLRYGLIYLLLGIALINTKTPKRYLQAAELVFLSIASVWSLETFLYTVISLDAFYFVNDLLFAPKFRDGVKVFAKRLLLQLGIAAASWCLLYIYIHGVSGQFPDIRIYFDYFQVHVDHIPSRDDAIVPHMFRTGATVFVYLFSIFAVLFDGLQRKKNIPTVISSILVGMSVAGILQYVYYFIFYIDFHLALLCVPVIFVLALWVAVIRQSAAISFPLRTSIIAVLFVSLVTSMVATTPNFYNKFSKSLLYMTLVKRNIAFTNPYRVSPSNQSVEFLVYLIEKYAGEEQQIVIFAAPDDQVEAFFLTGKTDLLGMSQAEMSAVSPIYSGIVLHKAKVIAGKSIYIFYSIEEKDLISLQKEAYQILIDKTRYVIIDQKGNIVVLKKAN